MKKNTISQFDQVDIQAAQNEADGFGFREAFRDWKSHTRIDGGKFGIAFTWFVAGIIVGKKLMIEDMSTGCNVPGKYKHSDYPASKKEKA